MQTNPNVTLLEVKNLAMQLPAVERWELLKTLIYSVEPETDTSTPEYPQPQFYGCIQDETFFRHPQGEQQKREEIL
ncbi:hypothetical protein [Rivularia sp. UHCC 0363]|uniref:hypothetical protein n=1 Tax=Rivularia sp. UHCC 0363 TaxID=3110244 RepID=UPI002B1FA203|nr:hypothetical protein [Rivularia sp. UHCC 0363]MEA5593435.1 hypothetical protein [Rivularia sp. UHCC 0363]